MRRIDLLLVGPVSALATLVSCSPDETDYKEAAEDLIGGELADQIGLGELEGTCGEPESDEPGTEFTCTAATGDGRSIEFRADIGDDDDVNVVTTNLLAPTDVTDLEGRVGQALGDEVGQAIPASDVDCGEVSIIVENGEPFTCRIVAPVSGEMVDADVTFEDFPSSADFEVEVTG